MTAITKLTMNMKMTTIVSSLPRIRQFHFSTRLLSLLILILIITMIMECSFQSFHKLENTISSSSTSSQSSKKKKHITNATVTISKVEDGEEKEQYIQQQHHPSHEDGPLWSKLGITKCRFPNYFMLYNDVERKQYPKIYYLTAPKDDNTAAAAAATTTTTTTNISSNTHSHNSNSTNSNDSNPIWINADWKQRHDVIRSWKEQQMQLMKQQQQHYLNRENDRVYPLPTNEYYHMLLRYKQQQQQQSQYSTNNNAFSVSPSSLLDNNKSSNNNITFIHIGKAGGSTVGCHIAEAFPYVGKHCNFGSEQQSQHQQQQQQQHFFYQSIVSLKTNCYTHNYGHLFCYYINNQYIINVRNPIDRFISYYLYEHIENHDIVYANNERSIYCGEIIFNTCYNTIHELLTIGLSSQSPQTSSSSSSQSSSLLRMITPEYPHLSKYECSQWAYAIIQGRIPASYHNFFNYQFYTEMLFQPQQTNTSDSTNDDDDDDNGKKDIYVIRVEHLKYDWTTIDKLLGGDGTRFPETMETTKHNSAANKPLRNNLNNDNDNDKIVMDGMENLCRALCDEIHAYKRLMTSAINLNKHDLDVSLQELQHYCPNEIDWSPRICTV